MAYSIDQEEQMLAMFDKIANEPFVESANYNEVRNPRPIVESTRYFEGRKVNLEAWGGTEAAPKKNKTAPTGKAAKVTKNDTVTATKSKGQITKIVSDNASHEAKNEPAVKHGSFDTAARNAASSHRSTADSNKKFVDSCRYQKKCEMFKNFVSSLGVDAESSAAAAKIIRKFDELNKKAKMESLSGMMYGRLIEDAAKELAPEAYKKYKAGDIDFTKLRSKVIEKKSENQILKEAGWKSLEEDDEPKAKTESAAGEMTDDEVKEADRACFAGDENACKAVDDDHKEKVRSKFFGGKQPAKKAGSTAQKTAQANTGSSQGPDKKM